MSGLEATNLLSGVAICFPSWLMKEEWNGNRTLRYSIVSVSWQNVETMLQIMRIFNVNWYLSVEMNFRHTISPWETTQCHL